MKETADFVLRSYSKSELAMAYSPEISPRSAVNRLARWIRLNTELTRTLHERGYRPRQQIFTPAQVQAVVEYLGEP